MWEYNNYEQQLYHFGIKGMHWGERKLRREAKKDAKEFARAKMFYGEGAGTRRKLINATVKQKSKDEVYAQEFKKQLEAQDMSKHAKKAKSERKVKDIKNSTEKTARGVYHTIAKDGVAVSAFVATLAAGYGVLRKTGADKKIIDFGKRTVNNILKKAGRVNI